MKAMWQQTAVPYLRNRGWSQDTIYSRTLRYWGIGESTLAEKITSFFELQNPTVAPYADRGGVRLRISAKADSAKAARQLIAPIEEQLRQVGGIDYYGADNDSLASVVGKLLLEAKQTVAVAESCTGGGLGQLLTSISGSSAYFWGGVISYDNQVKVNLLGVNPDDLAQYGAVSDVVAKQMASGVRDRLQTTWGLSITGVAGPDGGTEEKPVGLVYIGVAGPDGYLESVAYRFGSNRDRDTIRWLSAHSALDLLRRKLLSTL
jgi:nicotinamide-nucleotide amidase